MAELLQPSFGGGEYAPDLWGRQDLGRFGISGRSIHGWIVRPTGGLDKLPGTVFNGEVRNSARPTRYMKFEVSQTIAYLLVLNDGYIQFVYRGAYVMDGVNRVEVAHPYADDELAAVNKTQSADTAYLVHPNHQQRVLRRVSATSFTLSLFVSREGPFRAINANEANKVAASAKTGTITLSSNADIFTASMVGMLFYMEPEALGTIKPWVQGETTPNLSLGVLRRSDGKIYRATTIPAPGASPNYTQTGNVRPVHERGREWDGPGHSVTTGSVTVTFGVEWEYVHSGYGIVEITAFTDTKNVTAIVRKTIPDNIVGGVGTPAGSWTFSGDGTIGPYAIAGASSDSSGQYAVTIDGVPTQPDSNYEPPAGGGVDIPPGGVVP